MGVENNTLENMSLDARVFLAKIFFDKCFLHRIRRLQSELEELREKPNPRFLARRAIRKRGRELQLLTAARNAIYAKRDAIYRRRLGVTLNLVHDEFFVVSMFGNKLPCAVTLSKLARLLDSLMREGASSYASA